MSMPEKADMQPDAVCMPCGKHYGIWYYMNEVARESMVTPPRRDDRLSGVSKFSQWKAGRCGVCQEMRAVTTPETYGGLVKYWQPAFVFNE